MKNLKRILFTLVLSANLNVMPSSSSSTVSSMAYDLAMAGQGLCLTLPAYNLMQFIDLSRLQYRLEQSKNRIQNDTSLDKKNNFLEKVKIDHKIHAMSDFKGFIGNRPNQMFDSEKHFKGAYYRFCLTTLLAGFGLNQRSSSVLTLNYINAVTSLPTMIHHLKTQSAYDQAEHEAQQVTLSNLDTFLAHKMNEKIVDKINAPLNSAQLGFDNTHDYLQQWRRCNYAKPANRASNYPINPAIEPLKIIDQHQLSQSKTTLPSQLTPSINSFLKSKKIKTTPRVMTPEEQSHIGQLPRSFYEKFPRAQTAATE
jgi:hypothetical protein